MAEIYVNEDGVEQSYEEAIKWWEISMAQGYDYAQYNLGVMFDTLSGMMGQGIGG